MPGGLLQKVKIVMQSGEAKQIQPFPGQRYHNGNLFLAHTSSVSILFYDLLKNNLIC